jgi:hypothetical protein
MSLFSLRDRLIVKLRDLPGFLTVGIGRQHDKPVLVVSVDPKRFEGGAPSAFEGYDVLIRTFSRSLAHAGA